MMPGECPIDICYYAGPPEKKDERELERAEVGGAGDRNE